MTAALDLSALDRLNRLSLTRTFTPQIDIDWSESTSDEEFAALYDVWSLFRGTGLDASWDTATRIRFVKYQQMNLMLVTSLLERHGITALAKLYDLEPDMAFAEYVGHFIKEEIYHHMMFQRAIAQIQATMPGSPLLPVRVVDRTMRTLFALLNILPGRRLRSSMVFTLFRFAEKVTIYAHQMVHRTIARRESLVHQVWAYHALDETRHVAFDTMMLERNRLWRPIAWLPHALAIPCCACVSLVLNANELAIARELGVRVRLWNLPRLMKRTTAPFKRRVFGLMAAMMRGGDECAE